MKFTSTINNQLSQESLNVRPEPFNFSSMILSMRSAISAVKWFFQSPTSPFLKKVSFPVLILPTDSTPVLFTSKFLRFSKLHSSIISCIKPCPSSSEEKGEPMNSANLLTWHKESPFTSSYFKNNILWGEAKLAFQYPKTWSQKGPYTLIPLQNNSNASSRGTTIFHLERKQKLETNTSLGLRQI